MKEITEHYEAYAHILAKKYGYELNIKYSNGSSCRAGGKNAGWTIAEKSLKAHYSGFAEYTQVIHVWEETGYWGGDNPKYRQRISTKIKGDLSVWAIALHEFAHIMQEGKYARKGSSARRDVHGADFQRLLKKLIQENPYREQFWISEEKKTLKSNIDYFKNLL